MVRVDTGKHGPIEECGDDHASNNWCLVTSGQADSDEAACRNKRGWNINEKVQYWQNKPMQKFLKDSPV